MDEKPGLVTNLGNSTTIGCVISTVEMVSVNASWTRFDKEINMKAIPNKYTVNISYGDNTTELSLTVKNVGEFKKFYSEHVIKLACWHFVC